MGAPVKKAADSELECQYYGESFEVRPRKWAQRFCSRTCNIKDFNERNADRGVYRLLVDDDGYRIIDDGEGE